MYRYNWACRVRLEEENFETKKMGHSFLELFVLRAILVV